MKHSIFILLLFCAAVGVSAAAQNISGRLLDASTGEPVAGAVVKAIGGNGFASSKSDGSFTIAGPASKLSIRCMGYETLEVAVPLESKEIMMKPKETVLREVVAQAPDIFQKGDTLVFNVGKYATAADNAIIDVIKRLPGVKVEADGTIMYHGKPINKFYIDGNDFIGDSYGLATNNISKDDVAAVELMENHQPVKALEDIEFSEQAGINLKLKEDARSRWVGVANAGSGFSPLLYTASAYAMRLGRKMQNVFNVKADNTGWNPENEIKDKDYGPMFAQGYEDNLWRDYISADAAASPLAENRTRHNKSWLANAITSWGKGDVSNRLRLNYIGDRLDYSDSDITDYLDSAIPDFIRRESLRTRRHSLAAEFKTEVNRRDYFLKDKFTFNAGWAPALSQVDGSMNVIQDVDRRNISATNDLRLINKTASRIFTLSSRNSFHHSPTRLSVESDAYNPTQDIGVNDFRSTTESQFGWFKGLWKIYVDGGVDINLHHLNSHLAGMPIDYKTNGVFDSFISSVYLSPRADYDWRGWRIVAKLPVKWKHYSLDGSHDFIAVRPSLYVNRQLTARSELSASSHYSINPPEAPMFVDCAVLTDYHNIYLATPVKRLNKAFSISSTYRYRNPLAAFFANATAGYTRSKAPYTVNQLFQDNLIITTFSQLSSGSDSFFAEGGVSKGLCHSRLVMGLDASCSSSKASSMRDGVRQQFRQLAISMNPYFKGSLTKWLSMNYSLNLNHNSLKVAEKESANTTSMRQNLSLTFIPSDDLYFTLGGEHYLTHFGDKSTADANLVLLDASATWRIKGNVRLSLTARNLLNEKTYRYTTFGTLSQSEHSYTIRPRNILASLQIRF